MVKRAKLKQKAKVLAARIRALQSRGGLEAKVAALHHKQQLKQVLAALKGA